MGLTRSNTTIGNYLLNGEGLAKSELFKICGRLMKSIPLLEKLMFIRYFDGNLRLTTGGVLKIRPEIVSRAARKKCENKKSSCLVIKKSLMMSPSSQRS